jgi:CheY-specific phosphatase CheX
MEAELKDKLYRVSARTFEELAFLLPAREAPAEPLVRAAAVRYTGPFSGRLVVKVSARLRAALAANMLGAEGISSEEEQDDALREAANVVCGNFLPEIGGRSYVFHLGAPELGSAAAAQGAAAAVMLPFEEGLCEIEFYRDL